MLTFRLLPVLPGGACGCGDLTCTQAGKHPAERWRSLPADRPELTPTADAGVGIATGESSGIFVVDLDVKDGKNGIAELERLGPIPETYAVATPSGGVHLYFQHPGFRVRNSGPKSNPIGPGIDVRGDGGYVVAPGSPHRNGGRYAVAHDAPISEAPAWLLAHPALRHAGVEVSAPAEEIESKIKRAPRDWRIAKAKSWLAAQPPAVEGQGGDDYTFKLVARAVHEWCLTDADMIDEAFIEWNARCEPPWTGPKWMHKVDSALHRSTMTWNDVDLAYVHEQIATKPLAEIAVSRSYAPGVLWDPDNDYDAPLPSIDYWVDGFFARGDVVMLVAHGNSLKTWLAFSVAHALASGRPWLGQYATKRGRVGIVDFESGSYEVKRRLKLLGVRNEQVGDRLLRISYPALDLTSPEAWIELAKSGLDLLVIDSFNAAQPATDENDARAALMLVLAGKFAEQTGCIVIVIHHSRKGSGGDRRESVRGSTAIFAACDRIFEFSEPEKKDGGVVLTTMSSVKDGAGRRPLDVRVELSDQGLRWVEMEDKPEEKPAPTVESNQALAVKILISQPAGIQKAQLRDLLEGRHDTRLKALSLLHVAGTTVEYTSEKKVFVMLNPNMEKFQ